MLCFTFPALVLRIFVVKGTVSVQRCMRQRSNIESVEEFKYTVYLLVGFGHACAPGALRAPVLWDSLSRKTGRCAPPPHIAASLLLIRFPKLDKNYRTWAAPVMGFPEIKCFSSGSRAWGLGVFRRGQAFFIFLFFSTVLYSSSSYCILLFL